MLNKSIHISSLLSFIFFWKQNFLSGWRVSNPQSSAWQADAITNYATAAIYYLLTVTLKIPLRRELISMTTITRGQLNWTCQSPILWIPIAFNPQHITQTIPASMKKQKANAAIIKRKINIYTSLCEKNNRKPPEGLEPPTGWLQISYSTNWVMTANCEYVLSGLSHFNRTPDLHLVRCVTYSSGSLLTVDNGPGGNRTRVRN